MNFNSKFFNLQNGIPLTSALKIKEDEELIEVDTLTNKGVPLHKPKVYITQQNYQQNPLFMTKKGSEIYSYKIVFVKPRWTPVHQREHIETEVNA